MILPRWKAQTRLNRIKLSSLGTNKFKVSWFQKGASVLATDHKFQTKIKLKDGSSKIRNNMLSVWSWGNLAISQLPLTCECCWASPPELNQDRRLYPAPKAQLISTPTTVITFNYRLKFLDQASLIFLDKTGRKGLSYRPIKTQMRSLFEDLSNGGQDTGWANDT